jgi:hypothetical protein
MMGISGCKVIVRLICVLVRERVHYVDIYIKIFLFHLSFLYTLPDLLSD